MEQLLINLYFLAFSFFVIGFAIAYGIWGLR